MELAANKWFSSWFDTPYYHILYKNRGDAEAQDFMQNLVRFLKLHKGASVLDLACGKGRHSVYLNKLGYDVTGVDLSSNSITYAKQFENENLRFKNHCMCKPLEDKFDAVFNLFTSLGYFEDERENFESIKAIKEEIKEGGWGVIDFMNVHKVVANLVPREMKTVRGIDFYISRRVENGFILKDIEFEDEGEEYSYTERVKAISLTQFKKYFEAAGIELVHTFGDYQLRPYCKEQSDRLILLFR
ncbi:class I SAM-dependent methyltransferase [Salinimicrobium oceani]|uniref:Methyltransferase domain-containing protein n=1 Tax=Salinimicrobium oceani TaxID=2722702 RepID=A0ABX1D0U1_9FLAO|nr:class I SAM-dependent methyltransferase [Salinimicrobium oceani]NJW54111.1 methyltransferase domain-containing protein [Salinimicrobium oceani]